MTHGKFPTSALVLPIDAQIKRTLDEVQASRSVVLQAAPGTGKTTRVPPALLKILAGEVLVLEPRRLAAKMAARRVAFELGEEVGGTVGYQFRYENVSGPKTRLRFLTEGMLMRKLLGDPELRGVAAVVLDEFHERHLHTDVAFAFLRRLQQTTRPDLKILVMSATLETEALASALGGAPVIRAEGKAHSVEMEYLDQAVASRPLDGLVRDAVTRALQCPEAQQDQAGDILVFLPGMADIRRAEQSLSELKSKHDLLVLPLHGELSREEQDLAVKPSPHTKVILATNVAESSVTIPGVSVVVDSGLARVASYSWWSGVPSLQTKKISRASATQRAGRAGRTAPGRCLRLYTKNDYETRAPFDVPEILRADLTQTVLELKSLGAPSVDALPWLETPQSSSIDASVSLLYRLGAVDSAGKLTASGREMVELPVHPRLGRIVLEAKRHGIVEEGAALVALLSERRSESLDLLEVFRRFRSGQDRDEGVRRLKERILSSGALRGAAKREAVGGRPPESIDELLARALLTGYSDRVAQKRPNAQNAYGNQVELVFSSGGSAVAENSTLLASSDYFVVVDAEEKKHLGQTRAQLKVQSLSAIEPEWLFDLSPLGVTEVDQVLWNEQKERIEAISQIRYDQLVIDETRGAPQNLEKAAETLASRALQSLDRICDPEALRNLRVRLELMGEKWEEESLAGALKEFCVGKTGFSELRDQDFLAYWVSTLAPGVQSRLERQLPLWIQLPRGRRVKVHYEEGKPPWIESRLQDFFGMKSGPAILDGKVPLTLHLLAPNQRAVQVTSDLSSFWKQHYPALRKELGRRYPRHAWPEDPLQPAEGK